MIPVIFINCKDHPFIESIMSGRKWYETRTSDTLRRFAGQRVLLAETGNGRPVVKCSALIHEGIAVHSQKTWEASYRELSCIPKGSRYDWHKDTKVKYCYYLDKIKPINPAFVPEGIRHGRVWMEYVELTPASKDQDHEEVTKETCFTGRTGQDVVIHRYGKNDYSVWFTDDPDDDTSGCSVRGTLHDILTEVVSEVPARMFSDNSDRLETIGCFIDIFEDFLEEKGIDIPNDEKDQDDNAAIIYGTDYGILSDKIESLLVNLGILNCK